LKLPLALASVASILTFAQAIAAQSGPWFDLSLPGALSDPDKPVVAVGPAFATAAPEYPKPKDPHGLLNGEQLMTDVHHIIQFSIDSRTAGDAMWGRVSGTAALLHTVEWVSSRLRALGLNDAHVETFPIDSALWFPTRWEVRLIGSPAMGAGSSDIVLRSAFPEGNGQSTSSDGVGAALVFIGRGTADELANVDLHGKIAVLHVVLNDSLFDARERGVANAAVKAGAVGAINVVDSPGNMHYVDTRYGCGTSPCFAVGGEDGAFLENAIGAAAKAGAGPVMARLRLESELREHLSAGNAVASIAGKTDKVIIVSAHADGWFDGANDNADGLAALIAEAGYFAQAHIKPEHTLIFMATAGHHNAGNGAAAYIKAHPEVIAHLSLMINLEHLAQLATVPSSPANVTLGFPGAPVATTTETPKQVGISTGSPYLAQLFAKASSRYGIVTVSKPSTAVPGDAGPYVRIGAPAVQLISASTFYHSTGDVEGLISSPGLARAAAFWADFIASVDHATDAQINDH
jgi:hypothetical protein